MRFIRSYGDPGFGGGAIQAFSISADENCETVKEAAAFTWATSGDKALRVAPEQPIIVWASTNYLTSAGVSMINGAAVGSLKDNICKSAVSFAPIRDHAYDVRQASTLRNPNCGIEIIDRATGAVASGVKILPTPSCREAEKGTAG